MAYLLIAYIGPMAGNMAFPDQITSSFKIFSPTTYSVGTLFSVCALFLVLSSVRGSMLPPFNLRIAHRAVNAAGRLYARCRLAIGVMAAMFGAASFLSGLTSYRYSEVGISEIGAGGAVLVVLVISLNVLITTDFFYRLFVERGTVQPTRRRRVEDLLLALALLVAADGILGVIIALVAIVYAVAPHYSARMVFGGKRRELVGRWVVAISSVAVVLVIFFLSEVAGSIIKAGRGREMLSILFDREELAFILGMPNDRSILASFWYHIIERSSIYYYSYQLTLADTFAQLRLGMPPAILCPLQTLAFRLDLLLGHPLRLTKPDLGSLMALNYNLLVETPFGTRPGSAPGTLGSFNYVLPFPLNILGAAMYLRFVSRITDGLLVAHRGQSLTLIGIGLYLMFVQVFFQSPFDLLMLVDGSVVYAGIILSMYLARKPPAHAAQSQRTVLALATVQPYITR